MPPDSCFGKPATQSTPIAEFPRLGSGIETPWFYGILNFAEGSRLTLASAVSSKKTASAIPALGPLLVGPLSLLTNNPTEVSPDTACDEGFSSPICAVQCAICVRTGLLNPH